MSFVWPWAFIFIPLGIWVFYQKSRCGSLNVPSLSLWKDADGGRGRYLFMVPLLFAIGAVLLIFALARPQAGSEQSVDVKEGIAIEMLVDVSSSMDMNLSAADGSASRSRMEVAKELVVHFIQGDGDQLAGRPSDLIGLITFARYADTRSPLTSGHEALAQIVKNLEIQERPNEDGTAYGDALALAAARLRHLDELKYSSSKDVADDVASKVIILLTDGENNSGKHLPEEAGGLAKEWGIKIYAISLGDSQGDSGSYDNLNDSERVLDHIARETGGIFRQANDYESLQAVYQEIGQLERTKIKTRQLNKVQEWFWLPLVLGLTCWLTALTLDATWLRTAP
ncbi:MAG: VWA domain-containing protein [Verrucomicrobiota bacterium]